MYQTGDQVVYGNVGVCTVLEICEMDFMGEKEMYYTLQPFYDENKKIYAPVDGHKHKIRMMVSKEAARDFIEKLPEIEPAYYVNEKERKAAYREVLLSGDMEKWAAMLRYIYLREKERLAKGQKISAYSLEEMKGVEKLLLGELAVALEMSLSELKADLDKKFEDK